MLRTPEFADLVRRSPLAVHIWLIIASYERRDGRAWCAQSRIARLSGSSRRSAVRALRDLLASSWITRVGAHGQFDAQSADLYELTLPRTLRPVEAGVTELMSGSSRASVPFLLEGDVFPSNGRYLQRRTRIPLSTLSSVDWHTLRTRSGQAMHLYLLLACYAPSRERVSGARLAVECNLSRRPGSRPSGGPAESNERLVVHPQGPLRQVRKALQILTATPDPWIHAVPHTRTSGGDAASSYELAERDLTMRPLAGNTEDRSRVSSRTRADGPAPMLLARLPKAIRETIGLNNAEAWALLQSERVWPSAEDVAEFRRRLRDAPDPAARDELDRTLKPTRDQPPPHLLDRLTPNARARVGIADDAAWAAIKAFRSQR